MINIYQPSLGQEELDAVKEVFDSNWLGRGPKTDEFIERFASKLYVDGVPGIAASPATPDHLVPISSCTEGLFQAIELYNIGPGDEVILPSISFIGAINAIVSKKATPVFCDVDERTLNTSVEHIEQKITSKTKAVIILHYGGRPCDIENIAELCKQRSIKLIEDNANSPFSKVGIKSTGTFGDIGLWSFDAMKQVVLGDGGMIYCKDVDDAKKLEKMTYLGLESKSGFSNSVDSKWWQFDISLPGRRCIINDIQAAIGIEQLKKIDDAIAVRKLIHTRYNDELSDLPWLKTPPDMPRDATSSYYMYHVQLETQNQRDKLAKYLRANNIYTTFRYYPLHWVEYFKSEAQLPNTEKAAQTTLCIPLHQSLSNDDVTYIIHTIKDFNEL